MRNIGIYVPARLGSQRLLNKQILPLHNDKCMFEICCEKLDIITKDYGIPTYVLICEDELVEIAQKYPNVKIILRDIETAKAEAPLQYIFKDVLDVPETHLMFLNPCLTFLSVETIVESCKKFLNSGADYGTSVKPIQNWIWDAKKNKVTEINYARLTTKEIEPWYQAAHCFHVFNREKFKADGLMLTDKLILLPINNSKETIDIDTYEDYLYAKWRWEQCD